MGDMSEAKEVAVFEGFSILGARSAAHRVRSQVEAALDSSPAVVVILNFQGVDGVAHSYADELLAPLAWRFADKLSDRVTLSNCTPTVWDEIQSVMSLHDMPLPRIELAV
jgi:hypothetical protein